MYKEIRNIAQVGILSYIYRSMNRLYLYVRICKHVTLNLKPPYPMPETGNG